MGCYEPKDSEADEDNEGDVHHEMSSCILSVQIYSVELPSYPRNILVISRYLGPGNSQTSPFPLCTGISFGEKR